MRGWITFIEIKFRYIGSIYEKQDWKVCNLMLADRFELVGEPIVVVPDRDDLGGIWLRHEWVQNQILLMKSIEKVLYGEEV